MQTLAKPIVNNALAALTSKAPQSVVQAIGKASEKTGVNFAYMVQQAAAESSFNPNAKAKTSSATGLYQFIESTWMNMVEKYGGKHGIETDGKSRKEILELRKDPEIAANMAAEFAGENERFLNSHWGGEVGSTELYFAHFMGAGGAASFLKSRDENPMQQAALLFPKAAAANKNVFYDRATGRAKTMDEVYAFFDKKFTIEDADPSAFIEQDIQVAENASPAPGQIAQEQYITSSVFTAARNVQAMSGFTRSYAPAPYHSLIGNPIELMMLAQLDLPVGGSNKF